MTGARDDKFFDLNNVMIIVPHQDDEILMTGGIIERCVNAGIKIRVVIATNGDCGAKSLENGRKRMRESLEAVQYLGLPAENVTFLGYADTGMEESKSFLSKLYNSTSEKEVFASSCSTETYGLDSLNADYHFKTYGKHASYSRSCFINDMVTVIKEHLPEHIFVTSLFDMHGDHSALYRFTIDSVRTIMKEYENYMPFLHQGIIHSTAGDNVWPVVNEGDSPVEAFMMPPDFETMTSLKWEDREVFHVPEDMLTADRTRNRKYQAILRHKSALKPEEPEVIKYLLSFVKSEEIFWKVKI